MLGTNWIGSRGGPGAARGRGGVIAGMSALAVTVAMAAPAAAAPAPGAAPADTAQRPVIRVTRTDVSVPGAPSAYATAVTSCPAGSVLVSGGMWGSKIDATDPIPPINGLRAKGTFPSDASGTMVVNGAQNPEFWSALGNFGGQAEDGDKITSFAMCAEGTKLDHRTVAVASVPGPVRAGLAYTTAACPDGTVAVGGGAHTIPPPSASLKAVGSFPSDAAGNPLPDGATNPRYWTGMGLINGQSDNGAQTFAYAVCAEPGDTTIKVVRKSGLGPQEGSTFAVATASCPTDLTLLGGGQGLQAGPTSGNPAGGTHLRGSYPSDTAGDPAANGTTNPTSWSAIFAAGGSGGTGDQVASAYALCADFTHATTTSLTASTTSPLFGRPVDLTAAVAPDVAGVGTPSGTVTFSDGTTPLATVPLTAGTATFRAAQLQPGAHQITASYSGGPTFRPSATPAPTTITVGFSQPCLTGAHSGPLTVTANQAVCLAAGGRQAGPVTVQAGGSLSVTGASISGPVSSTRASALVLCQATVSGPVTVQGSTGYVQIGSDHAPCAGGSISGPLSVSGNTAGLEVSGYAISGPAQITNNSGSGPTPADAVPAFTANRVGGPLSCSGNTPSLRQTGNTVNGPRSGQCA
ncbi:Ig-like domain repeat protein [Frankia sp. AgKG'84/4]|uniref:Ig-like domain repeat protein n=1 Tax=Frankia sp. AgKG'84/4 TaxID=573490 RepID=UPI00200F6AF9|nr:Ig-like domain repeat protein [Frankia sp. AgKG'84/4]MCL9792800.1 Ig-like domain repeat protein [Frankia sp. AgKG'84/4]